MIAREKVFRPGDGPWRALVTVYLTSVLAANFMAAKIIALPWGLACTVGALAIPPLYTVTDLLNEIYGKQCTKRVVAMGVWANIIMAGFAVLFGYLPTSPTGASQEAFRAIFGLSFRVVNASLAAYTVSSYLDVAIFSAIRRATNERHLWLRQTVAVLVAQAADSVVFMTLAFAWRLPWRVLALAAVVEYVVKIVATPVRTLLSYVILKRIRS